MSGRFRPNRKFMKSFLRFSRCAVRSRRTVLFRAAIIALIGTKAFGPVNEIMNTLPLAESIHGFRKCRKKNFLVLLIRSLPGEPRSAKPAARNVDILILN